MDDWPHASNHVLKGRASRPPMLYVAPSLTLPATKTLDFAFHCYPQPSGRTEPLELTEGQFARWAIGPGCGRAQATNTALTLTRRQCGDPVLLTFGSAAAA